MKKQVVDATYARRTKIVGVMGSGSDAHEALARTAGQLIARLGCSLLTGAGEGVMAAVTKAFVEARPAGSGGVALGVVRAKGSEHFGKDGYRFRKLNEHVELPVFTHLPDSSTAPTSRNHINVLTSDALVFLPGKRGTLSELELALAYDWVPSIAFTGGATIGGKSPAKLVRKHGEKLQVAADEAELERLLRSALGSS